MTKETRYASIPSTFDQTKHYIEQLTPVDMGEYFWVDIVIKDLDITNELQAEQCGEPMALYIPEPTIEERLRADIDYIAIMTGVDL